MASALAAAACSASRLELPSPTAEKPGVVERTLRAVRAWLGRGDLPLYRELGPENGMGYQEVALALTGQKASMVRINERGEVKVLDFGLAKLVGAEHETAGVTPES